MLSLTHMPNGKVGTAPGTTTLSFRGAGLGLIFPPAWPTGRTTTPPGLPGTQVVLLNPNGSARGLMGAGAGLAGDGGVSGFAAVALGVAAGLLLFAGYHAVKG